MTDAISQYGNPEIQAMIVANLTNDPIKLAIEALEGLFTSNEHAPPGGVAVWRLGGSQAPREALAALRSIKPDCRGCKHSVIKNRATSRGFNCINCTNFDNFQALEPVCLTKVTE